MNVVALNAVASGDVANAAVVPGCVAASLCC